MYCVATTGRWACILCGVTTHGTYTAVRVGYNINLARVQMSIPDSQAGPTASSVNSTILGRLCGVGVECVLRRDDACMAGGCQQIRRRKSDLTTVICQEPSAGSRVRAQRAERACSRYRGIPSAEYTVSN